MPVKTPKKPPQRPKSGPLAPMGPAVAPKGRQGAKNGPQRPQNGPLSAEVEPVVGSEHREEVEHCISGEVVAARYLAREFSFKCNERGRFPHEEVDRAVGRVVKACRTFSPTIISALERDDESGAEWLAVFIEANNPKWERPHAMDIGGPRPREALWVRIYRKLSKKLKGQRRLEHNQRVAFPESRREAGRFTDRVIAETHTKYRELSPAYVAGKAGYSETTVRRRLRKS